MGYRVAVVGATGNVGREMLQILAERSFPADDVVALASARSAGKQTSFGENSVLKVQDLAKFDFKGIDIVLSSPGAKVSAEHSPRAAKAGAVVIDNTSYWRMDPDVPLVVPEVNAKAIAGYKGRGIIANPNCSTIQMVVALKPIHDAATIKRVVVSTYQSTSGAGKDAMDELLNQTKSFFVNEALEPKKFTKNIAFNVIPHIDVFMDDGSTKEEWKMVVETKKILDPKIKVHATCVRVPVFIGHAEIVVQLCVIGPHGQELQVRGDRLFEAAGAMGLRGQAELLDECVIATEQRRWHSRGLRFLTEGIKRRRVVHPLILHQISFVNTCS